MQFNGRYVIIGVLSVFSKEANLYDILGYVLVFMLIYKVYVFKQYELDFEIDYRKGRGL